MLELRTASRELLDAPPRIAYVFPGQGSQYKGMGRRLAEQSQAASDIFNRADALLDCELSAICFGNPHNELSRTRFAQPAIYTHSIALLETIREIGLTPDIVAGHSMGEIPAYVASGGLNFEEGLEIVYKRAELMEQAAERLKFPAGMGVIAGVSESFVRERLERDVFIANVNAPDQIVVSGYKAEINGLFESIQASVNQDRLPVITKMLDISIPAHSPFMQPVVEEFFVYLNTFDFKVPEIPMVLNRTNEFSSDPEEIRRAFAEQLINGVHWVALQRKLNQSGVGALVEIGPKDVLTRLAKRRHTFETSIALDTLQDFGHLVQITSSNEGLQ